MTSETNELSQTANYEYNAAGYLTRTIDREDRVIDYKYDPLGRNTAEIWYADVTDADNEDDPLNTILYTYDVAGNRNRSRPGEQ